VQLPQLRQNIATVTLQKCALVRACRMEEEMIEDEIDILLGELVRCFTEELISIGASRMPRC
jgi:hypothetical protein